MTRVDFRWGRNFTARCFGCLGLTHSSWGKMKKGALSASDQWRHYTEALNELSKWCRLVMLCSLLKLSHTSLKKRPYIYIFLQLIALVHVVRLLGCNNTKGAITFGLFKGLSRSLFLSFNQHTSIIINQFNTLYVFTGNGSPNHNVYKILIFQGSGVVLQWDGLISENLQVTNGKRDASDGVL